MLTYLTAKLKGWLAAAGAVIALVVYAFVRGRASGQASKDAKQQKQDDNLRRQFDEIDRSRPDFDGAIGRLRKRSRPKD